MLENSMVLPGPRLRYAGTCETCSHEFETVGKIQRDEDGNPDYDFARKACAGQGCITDLCEHCVENGKAFVCEGCGKRFCNEHRHAIGTEKYCDGCYVGALESILESTQERVAELDQKVADYAATCAFVAHIAKHPEDFFRDHLCHRAAGAISVFADIAPMTSERIEFHRARIAAERTAAA